MRTALGGRGTGRSFRSPVCAALIGALALAGCASDPDAAPAHAVFELPRPGSDAAFFDLPWPSDLRRTSDGLVDVRAFPNPMRIEVLTEYAEAITTHLDGYGTNAAAYARFSEPVAEETLPRDPAATTSDGATAFLMDVDPDSAERGTRHPAVVVYRDAATVYWPAHTIAIRPVYGAPLAGGRTYAAVVTRGVTARSGVAFARAPDLEALIRGGGDAAVAAARSVYEPAIDAIEAAGVARDDILSLAVFTTQDPTAELIAMRDYVVSAYPTPEVRAEAWEWGGARDGYRLLVGRYGPVPVLQSGAPPYTDAGSGEIRTTGGVPQIEGDVDVRFALTVPATPMPPSGHPIVLYAHGTGGDFQTFVRNGVARDLAAEGIAVLGIDQVLHGERNPTGDSPDYLFFNFENPHAARDNVRQSVIDVVQQARLVPGLEVPAGYLAAGDPPARFDATRIYVYGHSQGGFNMPIFLAVDDQARGGILSGAGATLAISIVEKKEPLDIMLAVKLMMRLPGATAEAAAEREHFVSEHPVLSLLQTWIEAADASNYAHLAFHAPREGFAPKSVLQTEGLLDLYSTPHTIESLAAAMRNPQVEPVHVRIDALAFHGVGAVPAPVTANVAGGLATAGLVQFPDDGHFAAQDNDVARAQIRGFLRSFEAGVPTIVAP